MGAGSTATTRRKALPSKGQNSQRAGCGKDGRAQIAPTSNSPDGREAMDDGIQEGLLANKRSRWGGRGPQPIAMASAPTEPP